MAKPKPRRDPVSPVTTYKTGDIITIPGGEVRQPAARLSIRDVAKRYGVSEETVRRWIRQRLIPYELTGAMTVRELPVV